MPNDYITLNALASELNSTLAGGKIRRICQPEKDEITISVFNGRTNLLLVVSANPNSPRIHLTKIKKENPYAAPPLLMVLRKYIGAAVIQKIAMINCDRIIEITLKAKNEMFDDKTFYLVCELMGRYSNILLLDENKRILDALHKLTPNEEQQRCILVGATYIPPEQNKFFLGNKNAILDALKSTQKDYADFFLKEVSGVSTPSVKQMLYLSEENGNINVEKLANLAQEFADIYHSKYYKPTYKMEANADFYPYDYAFSDVQTLSKLNECADIVFSEKDNISRIKSRERSLESALNAAIKKTKNSIEIINKKLSECEKAEDLKITAELITCNLYKIHKNAIEVTVFDYYTNSERTIKLDNTLSPNDYAQKLFKKYAKLKRGKEMNEKMLLQNQNNLLYFDQLRTQLALAESISDVQITEEEMQAACLLKVQNAKKQTKNAIPHLTFEKDDFKIICGKGGIQNDFVTFKVAKEYDTWLHASKSHGSHVIILSEKREIPEKILEIAAEISAYYSERRNDTNVTIDYTLRKNVKRHPSGKIGLVNYANFASITVKPNKHSELLKN